jgi:rhomboid family GlyGly-CTERM serine protease
MKKQVSLFQAQRNFPFFTLLFGLLALAVSISPQMTSWFQFDREALQHGEIWRTLTGHLTHWSASHLFWDILVFLVLAGTIEWFSRRRLLGCFATSSLVISLLVFILLPEMGYYRGLSGIDSGLFILLLVLLYRRNASGENLLHKSPYLLFGLLFISKSVFELKTAQTLFVPSADLFTPVPMAHLGGALVGGIIGMLPLRRRHMLLEG